MASIPPSRKSRARTGISKAPISGLEHGSIIQVHNAPSASAPKPAFPLAAFLWPTRMLSSQWVVLPSLLMIAGLFRWCTGLWGYSGFHSPPAYGDFEAQRHWMELTNHVSMGQWYFHDPEWWRLDYPPLTAYHSWLLGKIGSAIDPSWFALYSSRGVEDPHLKIYMRATVLVSEYLVYVPAAVVFFRRYGRMQGLATWEGAIALAALLMQPALILIDHAHFQYNAVMLGFVLASLSAVYAQRWSWACVFFVAALGFKQMALYYAPAMFAALLAACVNPQPRPKLFLSIALVTLLSFMLLLAPFVVAALIEGPVAGDKGDFLEVDLPFQSVVPLLSKLARDTTAWYFPPIQQLGQVIQRIFPFARGIFEDKVANVWCTLNVIVKLRHYPVALLQRASLVATLTSIVPPCTLIFAYPRSDLFLFATAATALGFFLFGFMVHEKSVLLPLLPMTLILGQRGGLTPAIRAWVGWANALGVWTMFPLLKRVDLSIPYFVLSLLWAYLLGLPPCSLSAYIDKRQPNDGGLHVATKLLHLSFYLYMILWHFAEAFIEPPKGKPDLWVVLNVAVGSAGFSICYLWCLWHCLRRAGIIGVGVDLTRSAKT